MLYALTHKWDIKKLNPHKRRVGWWLQSSAGRSWPCTQAAVELQDVAWGALCFTLDIAEAVGLSAFVSPQLPHRW